MKSLLRVLTPRLSAAVLAALCGLFAVQAQTREARVVSAQAGGVNFISGLVEVRREGESEWRRLAVTDDLKSGDTVKTGADGLVEVLLNPGSYLRLGNNSEFELTDASLDDLLVKLTKGSAVIEATGYGGEGPLMMVETPQAGAAIVKTGIYRFNALDTRMSEVAVYDGRVLVGAKGSTLLRGGHRARVGGGGMDVAKFDKKKERDALDLWSKERAKSVAEVSRKLSRRHISDVMARSLIDLYGYSAEHARYRPIGAWIYSSQRSCYTFVPFGLGWNSPYGFNYASMFNGSGYGCYGCYGNSRNMHQNGNVNMSGGGGGATGGNTQPINRQPEPVRQPEPIRQPEPMQQRQPSYGSGAAPSDNGGSRREPTSPRDQ